MKPKNLILIGVAVVCGLVAAFLTARMTAGASKPKELDMVEVPVAAKDIGIGTKIPPKELEQFFVMKKFPREAVPPNAVLTLEELGDKRTMRPIRQGESVNSADVNAKGFIDPPDGMVLMSTPINLDQSASGFALPGYKVMVIASKRSAKRNMEIVFPLLVDALILAVDTSPTAPQAGGNGQNNGQQAQGGQGGATAAGFQNVNMISFAVTPDQSMLLAMAAEGGARLRIGLPTQDENKKQAVIDGYKHLVPTYEEILKIFADKSGDEKGSNDGQQPQPETVPVKVPTEAVPFGTQLTQEVLDKKFKTVEFPKLLLPETGASDDKDLLGQYVAADLVPNLMVPKPHLSKTEPMKAEPQLIPAPAGELKLAGAKVGHSDDAASPKADADTTPSLPAPKEYVYVAITTPQGKKYQKFEVTERGNKFVGDVTEEDYQQYQESKKGNPTK